jgi:hypothetical protein
MQMPMPNKTHALHAEMPKKLKNRYCVCSWYIAKTKRDQIRKKAVVLDQDYGHTKEELMLTRRRWVECPLLLRLA